VGAHDYLIVTHLIVGLIGWILRYWIPLIVVVVGRLGGEEASWPAVLASVLIVVVRLLFTFVDQCDNVRRRMRGSLVAWQLAGCGRL